ncbi:SLC13 family permease [Methylomagnum ishizawai]|uniref:SLC13 family permease n=1 Tax=Methylomagnum ishizawai TaxID=1760988 RepID=UPI001C320C96|nr:SLC13 family permease [Methylomagnum ishizawai]BBL77026.1 sodium:sulfate symporter [Methylomagnum ishizawai]
MGTQAWIAVGVVSGCLVFLLSTAVAPELILMGGVVALLMSGVLTPEQALGGFANEGMITVALMYVVVAGIRETGGVDLLVQYVLGRPKTLRGALLRLTVPVATVSAFMNNTPLVAIFLPAVLTWAKRLQVSPSKLLIPLSYAAVFGGTITLIGTSTNLIVNGLLVSGNKGHLGLFDIAWVGIPCSVLGILYIWLLAPRCLPERKPASAVFENPKEYTVEMAVEDNGPLVGKTIEEAGLRHLQGLYLVEIGRGEEVLAAVGPYERLQAGDRLVFAGVGDSVVELQRIKGLRPSMDHAFTLEDRTHRERVLVEAVVSPHCALIGKTLKEGRFRMAYGGSVIAIARNGQRLEGKLGQIRLEASDTLLLDARPPFLERHRNSNDFLLISQVSDYIPVRHERATLAWLILTAVVASASLEWLSMLKAAMLGASAMLLTGCCSVSEARKSLDGQVLLAIAASFGLGKALELSGAASGVAHGFLALVGDEPWLALALFYFLTVVLTELLSNNSVAVLMFPLALAIADKLGVSFWPFVVAVMIAASMGFSTPIGYQTNLMVYGPGGYQFRDFVLFGVPLNLLMGIVALIVIPWVWPFHP